MGSSEALRMSELFTITSVVAEKDVHQSDQNFEIDEDSVRTPPPRARASSSAPSDSNTAVWLSMTLADGNPQSLARNPGWGDLFLSEPEAFLMQVRIDIAELSEPVRRSPGVKLCLHFAKGVGLALAFVPEARVAVFGDEEDGVELLAHSRASMRQVCFEFATADNTINIISIDEEMQRFERSCGIEKVRTLAKAIAWLNPR